MPLGPGLTAKGAGASGSVAILPRVGSLDETVDVYANSHGRVFARQSQQGFALTTRVRNGGDDWSGLGGQASQWTRK